MEGTMSKPATNLFCLFIVLVIFSLIGCAGGNRGTLKRVQKPTEDGLRQDWKEYTVYYRRNLAFVYKIKDDRKIILDNSWVKVSSEDMMAKSKIWDSTWVKEIMGNNDEMFGYLVHRSSDRANVKIIDENTVQLYYTYVRTSGGP
jgi:5-methylcytosine-specific restriction endonuclease McrBC regulatory subunit McrC